MLTEIMPSVIRPNVILLSVMAPFLLRKMVVKEEKKKFHENVMVFAFLQQQKN
jgi:hypothetical protein